MILEDSALQLERHTQERIDKRWRALEKKEKKEAKEAPDTFIPMAQRPEATFIANLIDTFLEVYTPPRLIMPLYIMVDLLQHPKCPVTNETWSMH